MELQTIELHQDFKHSAKLLQASASCQLVTALSTLGISTEGSSRSDWPMACLPKTVLTDDWRGRSQSTIGGTIPKQVGLGCIGKLAEHGAESKPQSEPVNTIPPWTLLWVPALNSLNDGLWFEILPEINPFLPRLFLVRKHIWATESRLEKSQ